MITRISIRNFRSIGNLDLDANWITTFVGANDAGKSNILRALNLFFNGHTDPGVPFSPLRDFNQNLSVSRGKARQTEIRIRIKLPDSYLRAGYPDSVEWKKVWRDAGEVQSMSSRAYSDDRGFPPRSKIPALLDRINFTYIPAIKDKAFFSDLQGRLYDVLAAVANEPLRESSRAFEEQIQSQLRDLLASINEAFADPSSMRLPENLREIFESLEINSNGIPLSRRGDGIKIRHIPKILKFIADKQDDIMNRGGVRFTHIWGFEEPENNVEMSSCFDMANELSGIISDNQNFQLLITTHSPVFYRMPDKAPQGQNWVINYLVNKDAGFSRVFEGGHEQFDNAMGLMPLVAPYVADAKAKYDEVKTELDQIKAAALSKLPIVLVEGRTDKAVIDRVLGEFFPEMAAQVQVHDGAPHYGSAAALASRSLAWILEMRHRSQQDRVKGLALFDADEAGANALNELKGNMEAIDVQRPPYFRYWSLPVPGHLQQLRKDGFRVAVDLESYFSDEIWLHADEQGWLEDLDPLKLLSDGMMRALARGEPSPLAALEGVPRIRVMKNVRRDSKLKLTNYVLSDAERARRELEGFRGLVDEMLRFLL